MSIGFRTSLLVAAVSMVAAACGDSGEGFAPISGLARLRQPFSRGAYSGPMQGTFTAAINTVSLLLLGDGPAPNNSFPWSLVAIGIGGGGVLAVGGYLVARFLAGRNRVDSQDQ